MAQLTSTIPGNSPIRMALESSFDDELTIVLSPSLSESEIVYAIVSDCDRSDFPPRVREETSITCDGEVFMGFIVTR